MIRVEIVYAQPQHSIVKALNMCEGALITDALALAAEDEAFRGVDLTNCAVGVFGRVAPRDQILKDGDRLEIYRPLLEEPKLARRKRVSKPVRS